MNNDQNISTVNSGDVVRFKMTQTGTISDETVKEACANKNNGYWYCVTHKEAFRNQFEKDSHIHHGKHELAWLCWEHGLEQP